MQQELNPFSQSDPSTLDLASIEATLKALAEVSFPSDPSIPGSSVGQSHFTDPLSEAFKYRALVDCLPAVVFMASLDGGIGAVADTLDAMTSDRPYRAALTYRAAREEIKRCSGSQFDPVVVQAFLAIPEEVWSRIRAESDLETYSHRIKSCFTTP